MGPQTPSTGPKKVCFRDYLSRGTGRIPVTFFKLLNSDVNCLEEVPFKIFLSFKLCFEMKMTKVYSKKLLMKSSKNNFIFLLLFYLIMCLMKASKNFGKIAILKILKLISSWGVKIHFGKLALKWCILRHKERRL